MSELETMIKGSAEAGEWTVDWDDVLRRSGHKRYRSRRAAAIAGVSLCHEHVQQAQCPGRRDDALLRQEVREAEDARHDRPGPLRSLAHVRDQLEQAAVRVPEVDAAAAAARAVPVDRALFDLHAAPSTAA